MDTELNELIKSSQKGNKEALEKLNKSQQPLIYAM